MYVCETNYGLDNVALTLVSCLNSLNCLSREAKEERCALQRIQTVSSQLTQSPLFGTSLKTGSYCKHSLVCLVKVKLERVASLMTDPSPANATTLQSPPSFILSLSLTV